MQGTGGKNMNDIDKKCSGLFCQRYILKGNRIGRTP